MLFSSKTSSHLVFELNKNHFEKLIKSTVLVGASPERCEGCHPQRAYETRLSILLSIIPRREPSNFLKLSIKISLVIEATFIRNLGNGRVG
jgi:hypothetical protein